MDKIIKEGNIYLGQCGVEKSGNYVLYRILKNILEQLDVWDSFTKKSKCWDSLFELNDTPLSFPEMKEVDEIKISDGAIYHINSHFKASYAIWNIKDYDSIARLFWTHQKPNMELFKLLDKNRKWFYIIRDGRDVVNSWMHYAVSPRMQQRHPHYKIGDVETLYNDYNYFTKLINMWTEHIDSYLTLKHLFIEVKYENIIKDKVSEINKIVDSLNYDQKIDIDLVIKQTSIEKTKEEAPHHVRSAKKGDWENYFTQKHKRLFKKIAGQDLIKMGYEKDNFW
jgi:hypothetical protein